MITMTIRLLIISVIRQWVAGRGDKEDDHGDGGVSSNLSINSFSRLAYNLLKFNLERLVNTINVNFRIVPLH